MIKTNYDLIAQSIPRARGWVSSSCPSRFNYLKSLWTLRDSKEKEGLQIIKLRNRLHERVVCGSRVGGRMARGQCSPTWCICVSWVWGGDRDRRRGRGGGGRQELQGQEENGSGALLLCLVRQVLGNSCPLQSLIPRHSLHSAWLPLKYYSCWQGP